MAAWFRNGWIVHWADLIGDVSQGSPGQRTSGIPQPASPENTAPVGLDVSFTGRTCAIFRSTECRGPNDVVLFSNNIKEKKGIRTINHAE
jgi:hypothetical protein